jgi:Glycosyltransferase family 87
VSAPANRWRRWALDGLIGLALPLVIGLSQIHLWRPGPAIVYDWAASEMRAGRFRPQLYDDTYALQAVAEYTHGQARDILSPTPPTMFEFILPFVWLTSAVSSAAWLGLDILAPMLAVWLTFKAVNLPSWPLAGVCASLLLLSMPLWENNARGQVLHWQMLLGALVLYALARGHDALAGASLGLVFLLKLAGWPLWGVLALRARWRVLVWVASASAAVVLLSLPWVKLDTWQYYLLSVLPRWLQAPIAAVPAYQTVGGFWQHLLRFDPSSNPAPVADRPRLAAALTIACTLVLLGLTLIGLRRAPVLLAVCAGLVLTVVLAPIAEQYHYLTAAPALIVGGVEWHRLGRRVPLGLLLVLAGLLMFWPLPYKDPRLAAGWLAVLAYPRLWGGLLLWVGLYGLARGLPEPARKLAVVKPAVAP